MSSTYSSHTSLDTNSNENKLNNNSNNNNNQKTVYSVPVVARNNSKTAKRKVYRKKRKSTLLKSVDTVVVQTRTPPVQLTDSLIKVSDATATASDSNLNETIHKQQQQRQQPEQTNQNSNSNLFYMQYLKSICFVMLCKSKFSSSKQQQQPAHTTTICNKIRMKKFSRSSSMTLIGSRKNNANEENDESRTLNQTNEFFSLKPLDETNNKETTLLKPIESIPSEYDDDRLLPIHFDRPANKLKTNKKPFHLNCNYLCVCVCVLI